MSVNFGGPRGPFPGPIGVGTPPSGRFRNMYQQSPPPPSQGRGARNERAVTFMPNDVKIPRQPKQPDKPLPAYMRYSRKVWEKVKTQHPEMKMWDIGKLIGEQWRNLPEDERQGFFAEYEVEKSEYQEAMKVYHNSSAYRDWLKAKEKAQQAIQEQQMMEKMIGTPLPKEEPRFQLQQMEDDDGRDSRLYDDFSAKHVATARFQRNHKLIAEIFNESTVPDIKSIVTRPRLENLKKQVQSLMQHQKKLECEIQDMETRFEAKKAKILKRSDDFEENVKKLSEPPPPIEIPPEEEEMESSVDNPAETNIDIAVEKAPDDKLVPPSFQPAADVNTASGDISCTAEKTEANSEPVSEDKNDEEKKKECAIATDAKSPKVFKEVDMPNVGKSPEVIPSPKEPPPPPTTTTPVEQPPAQPPAQPLPPAPLEPLQPVPGDIKGTGAPEKMDTDPPTSK